MIDGDTLPRLGGGEDSVTVLLLFFGAPRNLGHGPEKAAGAAGWLNSCELGWDLAVTRELLQFGEGGVPEMIMPLHELGLVIGGRD